MVCLSCSPRESVMFWCISCLIEPCKETRYQMTFVNESCENGHVSPSEHVGCHEQPKSRKRDLVVSFLLTSSEPKIVAATG